MAKNKKTINVNENTNEMKTFAIILFVIIIVIIAVYFITGWIKGDDSTSADKETTAGTINYAVTNVGSMLNKPENKYYVMLYDAEDERAIYYSVLITNYASIENSLKVYYSNTGNYLNTLYVSDNDTTNPSATTIDELSLGRVTLIKVENGKITKYIEDEEKMKLELSE